HLGAEADLSPLVVGELEEPARHLPVRVLEGPARELARALCDLVEAEGRRRRGGGAGAGGDSEEPERCGERRGAPARAPGPYPPARAPRAQGPWPGRRGPGHAGALGGGRPIGQGPAAAQQPGATSEDRPAPHGRGARAPSSASSPSENASGAGRRLRTRCAAGSPSGATRSKTKPGCTSTPAR